MKAAKTYGSGEITLSVMPRWRMPRTLDDAYAIGSIVMHGDGVYRNNEPLNMKEPIDVPFDRLNCGWSPIEITRS